MIKKFLKNGLGVEDLALVILVVVVGVAVFMFNSGKGSDQDYQPSEYCLDVVEGAESNLSTKYTGVECECISPGPYRNDTSTPEKVRNVTYIDDVVSCKVDQMDKDLVFPLLTVNESRLENSGLNRSDIDGGSGIVN